MKKRLLALIICGALSSAALAGCSTSGSDGDNGSVPVSKSGGQNKGSGDKLTIARWGELEDDDVLLPIIEEFEKDNEWGLTVDYQVTPGDGYGDRLTTIFSSGDGYDIFQSGEGDFYKWVDKSLAAPIDGYMESDPDFEIPYEQAVFDMGNINGKQYYIVRGFTPLTMFYNKDVFDARGVAYPAGDWTWDDFFETAKALTAKDGSSYETLGYNAEKWNYAVYSYLASQGLDVVDADGNVEGYFNSQDMADALEKYFDMGKGDDRISPSSADLDTFGDATAMMVEGKLGMLMSGGWVKGGLVDGNVNYATALVPGDHTNMMCASGFALGTRSKNPDAAWELLKRATSKEVYEISSSADKTTPKDGEEDWGLRESAKYGTQPIGLRYAHGNTIDTFFGEALEEIIFNDGSKTTKEILDEVCEDLKSEIGQ